MRGSRGRNQFTKAALSRAVDVARQKGIDHVEVEIPGGSKIVFKGIVHKQDKQEPSSQSTTNEWDEAIYGKNSPPLR
jgi:hypothetical protein